MKKKIVGQLPSTFNLGSAWLYYTPLYFSLQAPYESFTQGRQVDICVHVLLFYSPDNGDFTKHAISKGKGILKGNKCSPL